MKFKNLIPALMLSLALACVAFAQTARQESGQAAKAVTGKIAAIDAGKGMLEVKDHAGKSVKLSVNAQTKVTREGKEITLAELKSGDSVSVEYDDAGGSMVAIAVTVLSA
ncbi:MAG TPA: hypothetical protein VNQ79_13350 [Blastocatellia bacterium]|nr:hypothetical protein [Blastocatellia bacterium]